MSDQPITCCCSNALTMNTILQSNSSVCTRHATMGCSPTRIRVRALPHSLRAAPSPSQPPPVSTIFSNDLVSIPVVILSLDHGSKAQATETSRQYPRPAGCDHRDLGSRQGALEPNTSQGRFWFRQHPSEDDQGMFLLFPDASVAGSHATRTAWPTNPTTSIWG